jgi:acetyl-CoA acyltransferase 2
MKLDFMILGAKRTPVGTFMGSLKNKTAVELGVLASQAALSESKVDIKDFSHSIWGNVCSFSSADGAYLARHISLRAGLSQGIGAVTVNRLCGSGFESIAQAAPYLSEGPCLVGGAENMSMTPLIIRGVREGFKFSMPPATVDSLWEALTDQYAQMPMGKTAEKLAEEYKISREECDRWAVMSHQRAAVATDAGHFKAEILPVNLGADKTFEVDEHIRRDSTLERVAKLKPVFGGVTTAANASGMNDAAAALIVSSSEYAKIWAQKSGLKPLAKVVGVVSVGCDPTRMGIGPVAAIQRLLEQLQWKMSDIDYLEINEAFAAQILAVKKALSLSDEQLNPHGSGISLGHPLGATGARISTHIAHMISQKRAKKAIGAACIGGGQGIAMAFTEVL